MIWPKEVTLVSRTQPSGPLCLWQCFKVIHEPTSNTSKTMLSCSNGFSTFSVSSTYTVHQGAIRNFQTGKIVNSEVIRTPGTCNAETYQSNSWTPKKHVQSIIFLISRSLKFVWLLSTFTKHPNYWTWPRSPRVHLLPFDCQVAWGTEHAINLVG